MFHPKDGQSLEVTVPLNKIRSIKINIIFIFFSLSLWCIQIKLYFWKYLILKKTINLFCKSLECLICQFIPTFLDVISDILRQISWEDQTLQGHLGWTCDFISSGCTMNKASKSKDLTFLFLCTLHQNIKIILLLISVNIPLPKVFSQGYALLGTVNFWIKIWLDYLP